MQLLTSWQLTEHLTRRAIENVTSDRILNCAEALDSSLAKLHASTLQYNNYNNCVPSYFLLMVMSVAIHVYAAYSVLAAAKTETLNVRDPVIFNMTADNQQQKLMLNKRTWTTIKVGDYPYFLLRSMCFLACYFII